MEDATKTWIVDDPFFFPEDVLGMRQPDAGFVLALESQSTDDGKVFVNFLQDQEFLNYAMTVVRKYEVPELLMKSRTTIGSRKFKADAIFDESEHGVFVWNVDDNKSVVMVFSTEGSDLLMEQANAWLGEAQVVEAKAIHGMGVSPQGQDPIIDGLMNSSNLAPQAKKAKMK